MVCVQCAIKNNQSEGLEETVEEVGQGKIGELKMEGGGGGVVFYMSTESAQTNKHGLHHSDMITLQVM